MEAIVSIGKASCRWVAIKRPANFFGPIPSTIAAATAARKQEVPEAPSQLKLKTASYRSGALVTGGTLRMVRCSPGTGFATVTLSREALMGLRPPGDSLWGQFHSSTNA